MKATHPKHGFTVIEMLVAIAIIGIISAIAIPNLLSFFPKSRLSGATRVLAGDLMATRMEAVKRNQTAYMAYMGAAEYQIAYMGTLIKARDLSSEYPDVTFADFDRVSFNSRGAALGTKTITLSNPSGSKTIDVTIAGRVKIN
ncbi:MAG: GspH/FimT family pseudopilin [Desulfobacterales bacterium]